MTSFYGLTLLRLVFSAAPVRSMRCNVYIQSVNMLTTEEYVLVENKDSIKYVSKYVYIARLNKFTFSILSDNKNFSILITFWQARQSHYET